MTQTALDSIIINPEKTQPQASIIFLHGLGASADDFTGVIPEFKIPDEAGVRFVFPNAPIKPVTINAGFPMPAWFDIHGLTEDAPVDTEGLREGSVLIDQLIEQEREQGVPSQNIILGGFSQGGAMALFAGLRYPLELAGIFGLSTFLIGGEQLAIEASEANQGLPIFMAHGDFDGVVPMEYGKQSSDALEEHGYAVEWHDYSIEHEVTAEELRALGRWLKQVLSG